MDTQPTIVPNVRKMQEQGISFRGATDVQRKMDSKKNNQQSTFNIHLWSLLMNKVDQFLSWGHFMVVPI